MRHDINRKLKRIKKEYENGTSITELSKKYGTSYSTMRNKLMKHYSHEQFALINKRNRQQNLKKQIVKSQKTNTTGYFRVHKEKNGSCKQGFIYIYTYYDGNGDKVRISRVSLHELKIFALENRLPWFEF